MLLSRKLTLIDSDVRRRASVCHALAGSTLHVEPFEDISEVTAHWPSNGIIVTEDAHDNVARLIEHMTEYAAWLPVVAFAERPTTQRIVRAIMQGAVDYLEWPASAADIEAVAAEAEANTARIGSLRLREARARSRVKKLTRREREVLEGVAVGLSNRLIGEKLAISPRTVEIHRANMLNKMGAHHTSEAIRIAIEAALVA
ncbi:MAG: response regulator transcription factor [Novosphingobium sp.]